MAKKSILYIITKSVWGGAAKYVYDLSTNLIDEFDVAVAAGGQGQFYKKIKQTNIPYYQITNFQRTINPLKDLFAFFEILGLIFQLKPNIIHVNSSKAGGVVGAAGQIYRFFSHQKINLIFTAHGWAFNEDRTSWQINLIKFFSKITALFYDKIICVSKYDYQMALKHKITPKRKLITIHNGIDLKNISFLSKKEAQKKLIGRESPLLIGTIAEWTKNKGLIYLIKATQTLKLKEKEFDVILIGSGENPDKEKMYDYDKKYNLDNVRLIEFIPNAVKYFKAFDIFVLPSLKEGLPYTIIEAMAAQIPIITTNVGGIPEMIENNINGILIKSKNPDLIGEKITYLINNPEKAQVMAQKAKQKVEQEFSLDKMILKTKRIYT
ncbi:glycosyltransferase family 4 protein [Patescibacteria group bacterium]|nr:glycosyltransferase family 4 protein [Patescibacteria group bacterium]